MPDGALVIAAVEREAEAIRAAAHDVALDAVTTVVAAGVGRVNAAVAVARMIADAEPPAFVLSAGVAGSLPSEDPPPIGSTVVAAASVYHEEGLETDDGFRPLSSMGFPLIAGAEDNLLAADGRLAAAAIAALPTARLGRIATVATCSGTDAHARTVRERTGATAEAMEGAAVLHAARVFSVPALEVRTISNTTGRRDAQTWDLDAGLASLRRTIGAILPDLLDVGRAIAD